jgi:hypothetical protein
MVQSAIDNTKSQSAAARWIGIAFNTYKQYAKSYGLWEQYKNQAGVGVRKGHGAFKIDFQDILTSKIKTTYYTKSRMRSRLIEEGYFNEECSICGWNEPRITDQKICLKLDYMDGNSDNKNIDNMRLLCPNCYFSNNGIFQQSKNFCK